MPFAQIRLACGIRVGRRPKSVKLNPGGERRNAFRTRASRGQVVGLALTPHLWARHGVWKRRFDQPPCPRGRGPRCTSVDASAFDSGAADARGDAGSGEAGVDAASTMDASLDGGGDASLPAEGGDATPGDASGQTDGGTPVVLASGLIAPSGIAVDSTYVYWTDTAESGGGGSVNKVAIAGGTVTAVASMQDYPNGLAIDAATTRTSRRRGARARPARRSSRSHLAAAASRRWPQVSAKPGASRCKGRTCTSRTTGGRR